MAISRLFNAPYEGQALERLTFPIGGMGSGMLSLGGTGSFSQFSLRHRPELFNDFAMMFSAISIRDGDGRRIARVMEGPVPPWKLFYAWNPASQSGMGCPFQHFGLPRFESAQFEARFPFGTVKLTDSQIPLDVTIIGWSPFIPGDADATSLPVGAVEYRFRNKTAKLIEGVYSFHARDVVAIMDDKDNFSVKGIPGGFHLRQKESAEKPSAEASFAAWIDDPAARANLSWFRGGWFDPLTMVWKSVEEGRVLERGPITEGKPGYAGSIYFPFKLAPGEEKTVRLLLAWHVPYSTLRFADDPREKPALDLKNDFFRPWYASQFKNVDEVVSHWTRNVEPLRQATKVFTDCFYDSSLPPEVLEAISANLVILKSPTVLRQFDGKMWAWEGCQDVAGSCHGTCTHVWNYAQALAHLFPQLERGLRETEFNCSQDERGHQSFRASIPLGAPLNHSFHAAADGQLGGVIKVYRDWRISGDTAWLQQLWPKVRKSLDYCIATWDPDHQGVVIEPHHNTYDVEFWGADGMCSSFYLGALAAAVAMGKALGDNVEFYEKLLTAGNRFLDGKLFNGEFFIQKIQWEGLRAPSPVEFGKTTFGHDYSSEAIEILKKEGPKYQYGEGCLSDGVLGEWMAWMAGLDAVMNPEKIESHLVAVYRHNFRDDVSAIPNPQRPAFAFGHEGGLILCSWPKGGRLSLPFPYSEEVWTGIEYQVASHLISLGHVEEGLEIVRTCRKRYDGVLRNPFSEMECGHWYARAMASYALLQALTGARYDAVEKTLYLAPQIEGDFRSFLSTATGFGTVGIRDGQPFVEVKAGQIDVQRIEYKK